MRGPPFPLRPFPRMPFPLSACSHSGMRCPPFPPTGWRAHPCECSGVHRMAWHGMAWHGMVCTGRTAYDACTLRTPHGLAGRVHASCHVERSPCVAHRRRSEPSRAQRSDHAMIIIGRGASGHQTREHLAVGHIGDAGDQDRRPRARRSVSARSYTPAGPQLPAPGRTASHDRAA